ncbi:MAG: DUF2975 domain-containing protein [Bacteroidetes bacterium]|nr:DUF2975 domain-containing protein [Bacteroidota bacterium]
MKPTLFHFVSKSLAEQFPLLPRLWQNFIGLLLFCLILMILDYSGEPGITINVKPTDTSAYANKEITPYPGGTVYLQGQLKIAKPTLTQAFLFPGRFTGIDLVTLLCISAGCIIMIIALPKLQQQHLFRKDISSILRLLGFLILFHGVFFLFRTISYLPGEVERLTNHAFTCIRNFPLIIWIELYAGLILLATASIYKKAMQLQEEKDLTI